jgi:endonuclease YncB( thermonuclease family)
MPRPSMFDAFPTELTCDYGPFMGVLDGWHDADTCKVVFDPGFDQEPCRWIRLEGVSAPELWTPEGKSLTTWVQATLPWPMPVKVMTAKAPKSGSQVMSFDRYVGTLYCLQNGAIVSVNGLINAEILRRQTNG